MEIAGDKLDPVKQLTIDDLYLLSETHVKFFFRRRIISLYHLPLPSQFFPKTTLICPPSYQQ